MMETTYRDRLQSLIFEAAGTRDVLNIPLCKFEDRTKIVFDKVRGSVRLMNGMVVTDSEIDSYIDKVLKTKLP